jgi:HD-GYP domain-containing protein (c-di-GMP phosphodiesterase class II)
VSDPVYEQLALPQYARMLRAAAEAACSVAYCTPAGEVQWTDEGSDERQVEEFLGELAGFEGSEVGVQRLDVGSGRVVLHACLGEEEAQAVGRLAVLLEPGSQEEEIVRVADALSDVAVCIERGQRLNREANDLAQELANRYEELNLLYSLGGHVRAFEEGSVGAQALLHNLSERLAVDFAAFVPSRDGEPIYADRMVKPMPNRDLVLTAIRGDLLRFACTAGKAVILNDPIDPRRPYLLANMPYRVLACPVVDCGPSDALLVLLRSADGPEFTNGDRSLAMVIANQTAIMMQNNAMLTSLQKFGVQMAGALIEAVEAKDPYTRGHSERVQRICIDLGKSLELSASSIQDISWGALLHDVGKIGVPDHIICKAGTLTQDEYTMIKIHPERSYEILRHIEDLSLGALAAARHHHERFDGGGYPHGLRGKRIPVEARVISIGDTYDALTSSRSYRAAVPHEQALQIIRDVAGTQLDPDLVERFERVWEYVDEASRAPDDGCDG